MSEYIISYAQNREDVILKGFFKDINKGFYIDVGANHPTLDSVTKIFYEEGWRGINIEPNRKLYNLLKKDRLEDINLQIGISDKAEKLVLREYPEGHGLSTFSKRMQESYTENPVEGTQEFQDYEVDVKPLKEVLETYKVSNINFMKVDVEGYEYEVLAGNDWDKFRPQILCIESNHIIKDWRPLLAKHGYSLVFFDGLNNYYVSNENQKIADNFSYPQALLARQPIPAQYAEKVDLLKWQLEQSKQKIIRQELISQGLWEEVHQLNVQMINRQRIRSLLRQLAGAFNKVIVLHIEKLNKPKVKNQAALKLTNTKSPKVILQELRGYDLQRYYGVKASDPLIYKILITTYTKIANSAKFMIKTVLRKTRRSR